ncbi:MAG TPA: thiol reductant ABC exporter subunit CydD [Solirubrobacteraceae bacterium]|nr:thiol reductant ABC exporter subunit CydD [Solirubrobacteraceae bacterium]
MRALDPRLLHYARATRTFLVASVALGVLAALLIVAQAWLLADVVARAFLGGEGASALRTPLILLLVVVLARAGVAWAAELAAARSSARAKSQLRGALLERIAALGLDSSRAQRTGELAVLCSRGVDALDGYFSLYLPQLLLAVIVPLVVVGAVLWNDWISAAIIAVTIPLIPLFMELVGATTRERMDGQFRTLERLGGHFLDVVAGLPTLKVFGRAKAQAASIREISERYRVAAIGTLRIAFLSSLILELVATVSVALVAVAIGLRLMNGALDLRTALFALVLAPEAYLPLRQLGANYHASSEGMAAAEQVFVVLQSEPAPHGTRTNFPNPAIAGLEVDRLTVSYPDRCEPALEDVSFTIEAGEILALTGPSGCGKSTLLSVLLGLVSPQSGSIRVGGVELADLDVDAWRAALAWVPQRPHLFQASIAENVRLGRSNAGTGEVRDAIAAAGLSATVRRLPDGVDTVLGAQGAGLSAGERQRLALARAFLRDAPLLVLDEPTANLDGQTEQELVEAIVTLSRGRTVVLVAHRPALVAVAHKVVSLALVGVPA